MAEIIKNGDSFKLVKKMDDWSIDLFFSSPPYNIGKSYENKTGLELYAKPYEELIKDLYLKTKDTGSVCWQVWNYIWKKAGEKSSVLPLDYVFIPMFINAWFKMKGRITWHFEHWLHTTYRFSGRHETVLWFVKDENNFKNNFSEFNKNNNLENIPTEDFTRLLEDWRIGAEDNLWWLDYASDAVWDIPNVNYNHPEKDSHQCMFPVSLVERFILSLTSKWDIVSDIFSGSGQTAIASLKNWREFKWFELFKDYVTLSKSRIKKFNKWELKTKTIWWKSKSFK